MTEADRNFARRVLIALVLIGLSALVCYLARVLLIIFAGVLGAILLGTSVAWISGRTGLSHKISYLIVLLGVAGITTIACWLLAPRVIVQLDQLGKAVPAGLADAQKWLNGTAAGRIVAAHSTGILGGLGSKLGQFGFDALDAILAIAIGVIIAAYVAATPEEYERGLLRLIPAHRRRYVSSVFRDVASTMGWWMIGQLVPMTVLGIVTLIGLLIIGIPLAFTLSIFTGLMIFIPFVGAVIAFIVTALVTLSADATKVPLVALVFIVVHILEGYILTPLVQKRAVQLPPAITILSQTAMTLLFGFLGLILATPIAAGALVLVKRLYLEEPVQTARL